MNVKEKILLVQLLLEDIRCNFGYWWIGRDALDRAIKARDLCEEIASELNDDNYLTLADSCNGYIRYYYEDGDGRWFREEFPRGYENMDKLHGLKYTYMDKSDNFKSISEEYLTYPEHRFEDWQDRLKIKRDILRGENYGNVYWIKIQGNSKRRI